MEAWKYILSSAPGDSFTQKYTGNTGLIEIDSLSQKDLLKYPSHLLCNCEHIGFYMFRMATILISFLWNCSKTIENHLSHNTGHKVDTQYMFSSFSSYSSPSRNPIFVFYFPSFSSCLEPPMGSHALSPQ